MSTLTGTLPDPDRRRCDYEAFVKDLKGIRGRLEKVAPQHGGGLDNPPQAGSLPRGK
jgi:hypothetical protein